MVLAQVLYHIAVSEKTQKQYLLFPWKRKRLKQKLAWIRTLVEWLQSSEPLEYERTNKLIGYISSHPEVFPIIAPQTLDALKAASYTIACQREWKAEWMPVTKRMFELIDGLSAQISSVRIINNRNWILSFMAFHNLPRVFWGEAIGLWEEPFFPLDVEFALQQAY